MINFEINSIINSNSVPSEVKDTIKPYTFIEFISKTSFENDKEVFLTYYKEYLTEWAKVKNDDHQIIETKELIQSQIIDLLKIITVSYATFEEQVFLSNLNWNFNSLEDPNEKLKAKNAIYSALPIFVSRIKDIAAFYRNKRTEATFVIERNKIKGTQLSVEKIIFDKILSFLFNENPEQVNYVQNYLNVSIDNFVDIYSDYFDIDRALSLSCDYNDIDSSLYFELENILRDMIFDGNVYLREIPLIAQLSLDLSQDCVGDKLTLKNELLESSKVSLISNDEKINIRKKLYKKYIGVDFYYLIKDSEGNITTDVFIKADNPSNNLLNQQTVDTPFTESKQLELLKNIGLFFKPDKTSLLRVNTTNFDYSIDESKVEPNKVYIFPDPKIYGNVAFNRQKDYPYIIEYSLTEYSKNFNFGWAANDPLVVSDAQAMFAYYSKEQDVDKLNKNNIVSLNFYELFDKGFISSFKSDLYGNKFAIFKEKNGKFARDWNFTPFVPQPEVEEKFLLVNGGVLGVDDVGVSTEVSADKITWTPENHYYSYFIEGGISTLLPAYFRAYIPNGATIGNGDLTLAIEDILNEPFSAVIDGKFITTDYNEIIDNSQFTLPKIYYQNEEYKTEPLPDHLKPDYEKNKEKTYFEILEEKGTILISITGLGQITDIYSAFPWWQTSADNEIYNFFIENAIDIDVIENIFIIKAKNPTTGAIHLLFEGIKFNPLTNKFEQLFTNKQAIFFNNENPLIKASYFDAFNYKSFELINPAFFSGNANICDKGSDIFYIEKLHKCYFAVMNVSISEKYVDGTKIEFPVYYPDIYEIDLINFTVKKYYFHTEEQKAESFQIPSSLFKNGSVMIQKAGNPCLTYSFDTNTFMLSYVLYDVNMCPYVYKHFFQLSVSGVELFGEIDPDSLDSTVYSPAFTGQESVITPGDKTTTLYLNFNTNFIVS